ncbi:MAG: endonuclease domain-containing protein [Rhodomicrobiaceae bacterium]
MNSKVQIARKLRRNQTEAEKALWERLRGRQLCGAKFRRQVPIGNYIADFLYPDAKLIVELDGGQHVDCARDVTRTKELEDSGFVILRFWNIDVLTNEDGVLERISEMLDISGQDAPL